MVTISGPWVDRVVGLTELKANVVYLDPARGPRIELIQFAHPSGRRPRDLALGNTLGTRNLAFCVHDIDVVVNVLQQHDVRIISDVQKIPDSQVAYAGGVRKQLVYILDPEGNIWSFAGIVKTY